MKSDELERQLGKLRFKTPDPALREEILIRAAEYWRDEAGPVEQAETAEGPAHTRSLYDRSVRRRLVFAVSAAAILVVSASIAVIAAHGGLDNARLSTAESVFSERIQRFGTAVDFSYRDWYRKDPKRKLLLDAVKQRFTASM